MFAIELMMPEVSVRTFLPVALATGTATFIGRLFFGAQPAFMRPARLPPCAIDPARRCAVALCACSALSPGWPRPRSSAACICSRTSSTRSGNRYLRHILGMLLVGVLIYVLLRQFGPLLCRGRRLRDDPGDPAGQHRPAGLLVAAVRLPSCWRPRSAWARARRAASSRPRCSWARRSAAPSAALIDRDSCRRPTSTFRLLPWSAWARWSAAAPARR